MTLRLETRADLDLAAYEAVAWAGAAVAFDDRAIARMSSARIAFLALLAADPAIVVYGVTSGYGRNAHLRFSPDERRAHARIPAIAPATAFGPPLPTRVVRGILLARLANFVEGHAAISPDLARAVAAMLDGRPLPEVPATGVGCPGEIQPLAQLFETLLETWPLAEKDALALVNGSPCASALIADAVLAGRRREALAEAVFALAAEALAAPLEAYDPALDALFGDPDEAGALVRLRSLLAGGTPIRRPYQAPVSWRILPRVLGQAARALRQAEEVATSSLAAVSDNPVFIPPEPGEACGRVLSNGGYHNARVAPALDALAASAADLALLADRQTTKLLDGRVSGLPDQLLPVGPNPAADGTFLGCLAMTALAFAEQARQAARTTLLPGSEGGGFGQNDVATIAFPAWRQQVEASTSLTATLAVLAVVASQALHVTGRAVPPALAHLLEVVRDEVPVVLTPRALGPGVGRLHARFEAEMTAPTPAPWLP